jgi:hypothetical protein
MARRPKEQPPHGCDIKQEASDSAGRHAEDEKDTGCSSASQLSLVAKE